MFEQSLIIWGLILIVGFPFLTVVIGERIEKFKRCQSPFTKVLVNFRRWVMPSLAVLLVMRYIFKISNTTTSSKITETVLGITLIYTITLFLNAVFTTGKLQKQWQIHIPNLLFQVIRTAAILLILVYILGVIWQVDLTRIASAAGIGSLVIALALQDTLSNLVSGFLLILESPFTIGDWIKVGDFEGEVIEINWRAVRLKNRELDVVIIPNGNLCGETIQNYTLLDPLHMVRMTLEFSYFDPPNRVIQMLKQTALATQGVMAEPAPSIDTQNFNNTAIEYEIQLCIQDYVAIEDIQAEFLTRVYYAAKRYKLTFPYADRVEYKLDKMPQELGITIPEITSFLKSLPYFTFLDFKAIENLANYSSIEYFGVGERIIEPGEFEQIVYIILEGSILVSVKDYQHHEQEVLFLSHGNIFGETALLQGLPSQVSVTVIDDLKAIAIQADPMIKTADKYSKFALEINSFLETRKHAIDNARGVVSR